MAYKKTSPSSSSPKIRKTAKLDTSVKLLKRSYEKLATTKNAKEMVDLLHKVSVASAAIAEEIEASDKPSPRKKSSSPRKKSSSFRRKSSSPSRKVVISRSRRRRKFSDKTSVVAASCPSREELFSHKPRSARTNISKQRHSPIQRGRRKQALRNVMEPLLPLPNSSRKDLSLDVATDILVDSKMKEMAEIAVDMSSRGSRVIWSELEEYLRDIYEEYAGKTFRNQQVDWNQVAQHILGELKRDF